jgi:MPBQ/MSBQ methyltransferase
MDGSDYDLKERVKARLFAGIAHHIDAIGYVPEDVAKLVGEATFTSEPEGQLVVDPALDDAQGRDGLAKRVNRHYDTAFYNRDGLSGILLSETQFRNIGYWDATTKTQDEASVRLLEVLLDFIPEKKGRILDVACGLGASTRKLCEHYPPEQVWAINISEKQIASTKANAPGCHAQVMNAVDLAFEDAFFDAIVCIEAAFHFETRRAFLQNALRVLKPGGKLVLSDVLFTSRARHDQYPVLPDAVNHLESVAEYRELLAEVGFRDATVIDARNEIWGAHFVHFAARMHEEYYKRTVDVVQLTEMLWTYYQLDAVTGPCPLVHATK